MAIRINLLPHREARRERQKKLFWFFTGLSAVAGAALVGMVWTVLQGYIGNQIERNEFISAENRKLDNQIKEIATLRQEIDALRARQRAVEDLQADRNQPVYMLSELTRQTPKAFTCAPSSRKATRSTSPAGPRPTSASPSTCATCRTTLPTWSGRNSSRSRSPASRRRACSAACSNSR
jgi:Tfp pilus assembly protein PilN